MGSVHQLPTGNQGPPEPTHEKASKDNRWFAAWLATFLAALGVDAGLITQNQNLTTALAQARSENGALDAKFAQKDAEFVSAKEDGATLSEKVSALQVRNADQKALLDTSMKMNDRLLSVVEQQEARITAIAEDGRRRTSALSLRLQETTLDLQTTRQHEREIVEQLRTAIVLSEVKDQHNDQLQAELTTTRAEIVQLKDDFEQVYSEFYDLASTDLQRHPPKFKKARTVVE